MTSLRETAKELVASIGVSIVHEHAYLSTPTQSLEDRMTEALEAGYKQGALARIEFPTDQQIRDACLLMNRPNWEHTQKLLAWYRDNMKITPLTAEDVLELLPSDIEFSREYSKKGCVRRWLRDFVAAKLDGK